MGELTGLYPALVTDLVDPDRLGRVQVSLPGIGHVGDGLRVWATLLSPYADDDQGFQALPEVGSQVVVAFEAGSEHRAYVLGACWNGKEQLPTPATRTNDKRVLKTRSGSVLEFDDTQGAAKVTVKTSGGHSLVLDEGSQQVTLQHANGFGLTLSASGSVQIQANADVTINAPAGLTVNASTATFSGLISCQTLQTNAVISSSYTPGAGNVW
jgi:uncharacterized protein involved in type VI secretion and phage assembly